MSRPAPRTIRALIGTLLAGLVVTMGSAFTSPALADGNVVTPGDFTGYGFDQCLAPKQSDMNAWLKHSPFLSVGIYISGDSRACRSQPNLTASWVRKQLAKGWRLLPITLGPQASCQPRFPRYGDDETIRPKPGKRKKYKPARRQGRAEATKSVAAATSLGIVEGSTLWYDLEGFNLANTDCRESALRFLSAWTRQLHALGYVSGVYSSAGSGITMLDSARVSRPGQFHMPDQIWAARWNGVPGRINDPSKTYVRNDGWMPHARVHQYQGGHDETWGKVRINIDRNFLDLGRGSVSARESHCQGVRVSYPKYARLKPATRKKTPNPAKVRALQCLLQEHGAYAGAVNGTYDGATITAANTWQQQHGFPVSPKWNKQNWMSLLVDGERSILKYGSAGSPVRRVQRALNAAAPDWAVSVTGVVNAPTTTALRAYQSRLGLEVSGVVAGRTWKALARGLR